MTRRSKTILFSCRGSYPPYQTKFLKLLLLRTSCQDLRFPLSPQGCEVLPPQSPARAGEGDPFPRLRQGCEVLVPVLLPGNRSCFEADVFTNIPERKRACTSRLRRDNLTGLRPDANAGLHSCKRWFALLSSKELHSPAACGGNKGGTQILSARTQHPCPLSPRKQEKET